MSKLKLPTLAELLPMTDVLKEKTIGIAYNLVCLYFLFDNL